MIFPILRMWRRDAGTRLLVLASGTATVALTALPDPTRPVLAAAGLALFGCVAAAVLRMRIVGSLAVAAVTVSVLLAGILDRSPLRPAQLLAAAMLLLVLVSAVSRNEDARAASDAVVVVTREPWTHQVVPLLLAVLAGLAVAVTADQDVGASVPLVIAGMGAAAVALVLATGPHRE